MSRAAWRSCCTFSSTVMANRQKATMVKVHRAELKAASAVTGSSWAGKRWAMDMTNRSQAKARVASSAACWWGMKMASPTMPRIR